MVNQFYHVYNRGVEKRNIFLDDKDFLRGVHDFYEFNDANAAFNAKRYFSLNVRDLNVRDRISNNRKPRELLVDLMCWTLMPNHYHHFSRPRTKDGLSKFQQKFGIGLTGYFNLKYDRSGVLFQGKSKKVLVKDDIQAGHLVCYLHSNPLDLWKVNWKEKGLTDLEIQNALKFLEREYRWSSHLDYLGIKNFPSLISNEFLFNFFGGPEGYRKFFIDWLRQYKKNIEFIQKVILE